MLKRELNYTLGVDSYIQSHLLLKKMSDSNDMPKCNACGIESYTQCDCLGDASIGQNEISNKNTCVITAIEEGLCATCGMRKDEHCECNSAEFGHSMKFENANENKETKIIAVDDALPTAYQTFIHQSKYARYRDDFGRRETWSETVDRYLGFFNSHLLDKCAYTLTAEEKSELRSAVLKLRVMPSMRALMTAGPALERDNLAGYNCAYTAVDDPRVFDEILYILMNGTGIGFSVERQFITNLPRVPRLRQSKRDVIHVGDSKEAWAFALRQLIEYLYHGIIPKWDMSEVRPAGARLKTFGGRSSGPEPLKSLFTFTVEVFRKAGEEERKLTSIEVHDMVCKIAEIVVVGGVRRSALISFSNLSDDRMRMAKSGEWWKLEPQRALANNSVCYTERPDSGRFMKEWESLYESKSGERGMFNRTACRRHIQKTCPNRNSELVDSANPCCEILLRNKELCNLSEVIVRFDDTPSSLREKVRIATILGTWQSTLTDFRYVSPKWRENCEDEHLLGVSLTGIMDNTFMAGRMNPKARRECANCTAPCGYCANYQMERSETQDNRAAKRMKREYSLESNGNASPWDGYTLPEFLQELRDLAIETNKVWAHKLGIKVSAAITCVKPSGTVSQLVDSSSGIHTRHARFYIRTVRGDVKDPLTQFMKDSGVPWEPCAMKPNDTVVFSFPIKAPLGCITRDDMDALSQLEICKLYNEHWCQHKVSVTINVKEHEWMRTGAWVYDHFDTVSGISFLPHSEHTYQQAPYQECDEETYQAALAKMPEIDWQKFHGYETTDMTSSAKELACTANGCEL